MSHKRWELKYYTKVSIHSDFNMNNKYVFTNFTIANSLWSEHDSTGRIESGRGPNTAPRPAFAHVWSIQYRPVFSLKFILVFSTLVLLFLYIWSPLDPCEPEDILSPEPPADHLNHIWHHLLELGLCSWSPVIFLTSSLVSAGCWVCAHGLLFYSLFSSVVVFITSVVV